MSLRSDATTGPAAGSRAGRAEVLAVLATLLWLGAVVGIWLSGAGDPGAGEGVTGAAGAGGLLIAAVVPVALIWLAVATLRGLRELRAEAAGLRAAIDALQADGWAPRGTATGPHATRPHETGPPDTGATAAVAGPPDAEALSRRLDQLVDAQRRIEAALTRLTPAASPPPERKAVLARPPAPAPEPLRGMSEPQAMLALGTPDEAEHPPVTVTDFLRALNFPDTAEDRDGFAALRRALKDPRAARLIRAAQDVLTLLSEDGLYMDDLTPGRTPPELWRRFARGERGEAVAALGAIDAADSLARAAARMREDAVFRDVAHHFLRHFDRMLEAFEPGARDDDLTRLADTRSGRAFMLLGRVTGIFG